MLVMGFYEIGYYAYITKIQEVFIIGLIHALLKSYVKVIISWSAMTANASHTVPFYDDSYTMTCMCHKNKCVSALNFLA